MIIVLFHLFYLLGKYVYKTYRLKKLRALCDAANDYTESPESYTMPDEISTTSSDDLPAPKSDEILTLKFSPPAYIQRYNAVIDVLIDPKYQGKLRKVVDFGCAELAFLVYLKNLAGIEEILCVDVDKELLERFEGRAKPLIIEYLGSRNRPLLIEVCEGSVIHNDRKLEKTDAVICIELIEHLYPDTLMDLPFNIFGYIRPKVVVITTPNADFNVLFPNFSGYRHPDHKFEWTRKQFQDWAQNIVVRYPCYNVTFQDICKGPEGTEELGACTQMAVFHQLLPIEECNQIQGVDGLFKTVRRYDYPLNIDIRSDEQKILDDAIYYINLLSCNMEEHTEEIYLSQVVSYMEKCCIITIETLRTILVEAGWTVEDRDDGPVVLYSQSINSSNDEIDVDILDDTGFINEGDEWNMNYEPGPMTSDVNEDVDESIYRSHTSHWSEEPSIVIPENRSVIHENTYLFDGVNSFLEEHQVVEEPRTTHNDNSNLRINTIKSIEFAERQLPNNLTSPTLDETELDARVQIIDSTTLPVLIASSAISNSSLKSEDTTKNSSADDITIESLPQDEMTTVRTVQEATSMFNFQSHLCVSRSSTSPEPLFFHSEFNSSLQSDSANDQNKSYNNQFLLNSTFQSETNEAINNIEESTVENKFGFRKRSLPREDYPRENKVNFLKCTSPNCFKANEDSLEQDNIVSMKSKACKNNDMIAVLSNVHSSNFNNQPKYTSSPKAKTLTTNIHRHSYLDCEEPTSAMNSKSLLSTREAIKETISNTDNNLLQDTSKEYNTSTETIKLCTSSNSDVINTSEYNVELCLELCEELNSVDKSTFAELMQGTNKKLAKKKSIINHETDVVDDVQNLDTHHILSLDNENIKHKKENVHCILAAAIPNNIDKKAHMENTVSDSAESNTSKDSLSPLRELLSFKIQSDNKRSFECAKETNVLENDKFLLYKNNKDASNIQLTSTMLKSEESISTSKDVNIIGLVNNVEAKSSPLETPPNSWSPEIMDSGYPNSASAQDITPEYDLSSIAQDHIPDSESPSVAEAPRLGVLEPIEVENGDLANNNRDDEGNNMIAVDANDIENLQPLIDVLENDLENENDIYVMQNGFPIWLLRILDMANPLDFDMQVQQNLRVPDELADDVGPPNYDVGHDEGFDSSSSENESDIAYNETENDNGHGE